MVHFNKIEPNGSLFRLKIDQLVLKLVERGDQCRDC